MISELFSKTMDLFLERGHEHIGDGSACEMVGDFKVHVTGSKAGPIYVGLGQQYQAEPFSAVFVRHGIVIADVTPAGGVVIHGAEDDLIALIDAALGPDPALPAPADPAAALPVDPRSPAAPGR